MTRRSGIIKIVVAAVPEPAFYQQARYGLSLPQSTP